MSNYQTSRNINKLFALMAQIKELQAQADAIKGEFKESGIGEYRSADHILLVAEKSRVVLDSKAVKELLSPAQIEACSKVSSYLEVNIK